MIKTFPSRIKLPNYDLTVEFKTVPSNMLNREGVDGGAFGRFGVFDLRTYTITLMKTNPEFDPYSYLSLLTAALIFCQDIKLSVSKMSSLTFILHYLFKYNDIKAKCAAVQKNKDLQFDLLLPGFIIDVAVSSEYKESPGCVSVQNNYIKINKDVSARVKPVVLIHEIIEWTNVVFSLGMAHHTIQSFSELLVFVIINNNFVS